MQLAERCLDCPLSVGDAFGLVLVSLSLLLFGRVLLAIPRTLLRGFGVLGLAASLVLHAFGLSTVALLGIAWRTRSRLFDTLFACGWLAASALVLAAGARIGRAFPHRRPRLRVLDPTDRGGAPERPDANAPGANGRREGEAGRR